MKFASYSKKAKVKVLLFIIVFLALGASVIMVKNHKNSICPLDFEDKNEYVESAANWLTNYYKKNPQALEEEILKARMDYLLEIGCVDTKNK